MACSVGYDFHYVLPLFISPFLSSQSKTCHYWPFVGISVFSDSLSPSLHCDLKWAPGQVSFSD